MRKLPFNLTLRLDSRFENIIFDFEKLNFAKLNELVNITNSKLKNTSWKIY